MKMINIEQVRTNPDAQYDRYLLSQCRDITIADVDTLHLPNTIGIWDWDMLSQFININEIRNNPNRPWNKRLMSYNTTITNDDIKNLYLPNSRERWVFSSRETINDWYHKRK